MARSCSAELSWHARGRGSRGLKALPFAILGALFCCGLAMYERGIGFVTNGVGIPQSRLAPRSKWSAKQKGGDNMLEWSNATETPQANSSSGSDDLQSSGLSDLQSVLVDVSRPSQQKLYAAHSFADMAMMLGQMLKEALSSQKVDITEESIREVQQALADIPFKKYSEASTVTLKKGIPLRDFEDFIRKRIALRYGLSEKHVEELCDAMYCEANQVSITEFVFKDPTDKHSGDESSSFTLARMAVFRRPASEGGEVIDLGLCLFKVDFEFGKQLVIEEKKSVNSTMTQHKFMNLFDYGLEVTTHVTTKTEHSDQDLQMTSKMREQFIDYFRHRAVTSLQSDQL